MGFRTSVVKAGVSIGVVLLAATGCRSAVGAVDVVAPPQRASSHCQVEDLTASVGEFGSMASQPFLTVKLTNHTSSACRLRGYPRLTIFGSFVAPPNRPVHTDVAHGSTYERADPGPHTIVVAPHRFASFTIGTATANTGPMAMLHRFEIRLVRGDDALVVRQEMPANGPRGEPIPVKETALGLGMPRH